MYTYTYIQDLIPVDHDPSPGKYLRLQYRVEEVAPAALQQTLRQTNM